MEIDLDGAYKRYADLNEEEKNIIRNFMNGPARKIIGTLFGPDFERALGTFAAPSPPSAPTPAPKQRTMAPTMPQQQPPVKPQGLAARPQR